MGRTPKRMASNTSSAACSACWEATIRVTEHWYAYLIVLFSCCDSTLRCGRLQWHLLCHSVGCVQWVQICSCLHSAQLWCNTTKHRATHHRTRACVCSATLQHVHPPSPTTMNPGPRACNPNVAPSAPASARVPRQHPQSLHRSRLSLGCLRRTRARCSTSPTALKLRYGPTGNCDSTLQACSQRCAGIALASLATRGPQHSLCPHSAHSKQSPGWTWRCL